MNPLSCLNACALIAALTIAAAPSAAAHGAFAIGGSTADAQNGFAAGYSWNQPTKDAAEAQAMEQCKAYPSEAPAVTNAKCAVVADFAHQWLVIAMDPDPGTTGFGYSMAADQTAAEISAMSQCVTSSTEERKSHCAVAASKLDDTP